MRPQRHAVAVVDQRVARDACLLVIRAAKSAVDDNQFAAALDRFLAFNRPNRYMPIDDVAVRRSQPKFRQNTLDIRRVVNQPIIRIFDFRMCRRISDIQALEGRHGAPPVDRRDRAAPQIPQEILPDLPLPAALRRKVPHARTTVAAVEPPLAAILRVPETHGGELPVFIHRHSAVVEQIAVHTAVHRAL